MIGGIIKGFLGKSPPRRTLCIYKDFARVHSDVNEIKGFAWQLFSS